MAVRPGARRLAVWTLACALVAGAAAPAVAGAVDGPAVPAGDPGTLAQRATPANETVRHEDPDSVSRRGDVGRLERYLADRLSERLGEGSASIGRGEYESARSALGEGYEGLLSRYVDVAGGTAGSADDEAAEAFREAGEGARSFADASSRFEATYRAYRRATERGDEARARELARRLVELADRVDRRGGDVRRELDVVSNRTGSDLSGPKDEIEGVARNATERADAVARETFTRTRVEASANRSTVSFRRPVAVRGRLVDENGTALANRTVLVGNGSEAAPVETDASGRFAATYRPVRLPVEPGAVPVRFVPANASVYLGNRTAVGVAVEPVTPAVTAAVVPGAAAFDDRVVVAGRVAVDGAPVPGVPVRVAASGVPLGRAVTGEDGRFAVALRLPADVPAGERTVEARVAQDGRAVARASASAPLSVEPTATALSLDASAGVNGTAGVSGRLRTVDGVGVANRSVHVLVAGSAVRTVETDGAGRFSARVPVPDGAVGADGNVTVGARFDGGGTNLEGSRVERTLRAPWVEPGGAGAGVAWWPWAVGLAAVALVAAGAALLLRRAGRGDDGPDVPAGAGRGVAVDAGGTPAVGTDWREAVEALLDAGETDAAVARAYGAARGRLAEELGATGALTHWEFYAAAADDGVSDARVEALLALTEAYERARFAPAAVSAEDAAAAVERAAAVSG